MRKSKTRHTKHRSFLSAKRRDSASIRRRRSRIESLERRVVLSANLSLDLDHAHHYPKEPQALIDQKASRFNFIFNLFAIKQFG